MEFFEFAAVTTTGEVIQENITIKSISGYSTEIETVEDEGEQDMVIYFSHWGRFHIRCETVIGGLRFSVPDCPNALAWTITTGYPPHPEKIVIHATINRTDHDPEFIEGVKNLLATLKIGFEETHFNTSEKPATPPAIKLADFR